MLREEHLNGFSKSIGLTLNADYVTGYEHIKCGARSAANRKFFGPVIVFILYVVYKIR
jgi:hypothetical protein